jgi:hypothetical protein
MWYFAKQRTHQGYELTKHQCTGPNRVAHGVHGSVGSSNNTMPATGMLSPRHAGLPESEAPGEALDKSSPAPNQSPTTRRSAPRRSRRGQARTWGKRQGSNRATQGWSRPSPLVPNTPSSGSTLCLAGTPPANDGEFLFIASSKMAKVEPATCVTGCCCAPSRDPI